MVLEFGVVFGMGIWVRVGVCFRWIVGSDVLFCEYFVCDVVGMRYVE